MAHRATPVKEPRVISFGLMAVVGLGTVVFGDFANDIAGWIVCADAYLRAEMDCSELSIKEAAIVATMFSTFVAILGASYVGRWGGKTPKEAALLIIAALAAAYISVLKAAVGEHGFPQPDLLIVPTFVFLASVIVLLAPYILMLLAWGSAQQGLALIQRISLAIFIGAFLGSILQLADEVLWRGPGADRTVSNLVVAPAATVAGGAIFGTVILDPWLRFGVRRFAWGILWTAVGLMLAVAYMVYYVSIHNWVNFAESPVWLLAVQGTFLLASGILSVTIAFWVSEVNRIRRSLLVFVPLVAVTAAVVAYRLGSSRIAANQITSMTSDDLTVFVAIHAAAPVFCVMAILTAEAIASYIDRPGWV